MLDNQNLTPDQIAIELFKCKNNCLYFIDNYVKIAQGSGEYDYKLDVTNKKLIRYIKTTIKFKKSIFMASRQLGKTTASAILLLWSTMFFNGSRAAVITIKKNNAIELIRIIKFIHSKLPPWMAVPMIGKGRLLTYIHFTNGSMINTLYISASSPPDAIGRGLTVPIILIDEVAFIRKISEAFG